MSTKFSVRPVPRKRPWTCKRSPPCLVPPLIPARVLCTYSITVLAGPHVGLTLTGSYHLKYTGIDWQYYALHAVPGATFETWWEWLAPTGTAAASSTYQAPSYVDWVAWPTTPAAGPPRFFWSSYTPKGLLYRLKGLLLITA